MSPFLWLLFACGGARLEEPLALPQAEVVTTLASKQVPEGEPLLLTVSIRWALDWQPDLAGTEPQVEGLSATLVEERTLDGERARSLQVWELKGPAGSYILPPLSVTFAGPEGTERTMESAPLYADIGTEGPRSELGPMLLAPVPESMAWWPFALAGALGTLGLGAWWWRRRRDSGPVLAPPIPPDVAALAAWEALQADPSLDDHARAVALSALFRRYLEQVLAVAATTATSREILGALDLPETLQQPTRRLLTATDLIKFARRGGGHALFTELDADLRLIIDVTRPVPVPVEEGD